MRGIGKINSYFDFLGRLIQFFLLTILKNRDFLNLNIAFSIICLTVLNFFRNLLVDNHLFYILSMNFSILPISIKIYWGRLIKL